MRKSTVYTLAFTLPLLGACASGGKSATDQPVPQRVEWNGDSLLAPILTAPVMSTRELVLSDTIASRLGDEFSNRLAAVIADTTAPVLVRVNAVMLMSDRREARHFTSFLDALAARDDRIRAAAIVGLRNYIGPFKSALDLVRTGLTDPSPLVQTKALEVLSDLDTDLLRNYLKTAATEELRTIARELIRTGEERGAMLIPIDSLGTLERRTPTGVTLTYRPQKRWPNWSASVGELWLARGREKPVKISDSVEVVKNVIPAFLDPEGESLVYEANRQIRLRDLNTGSERLVGPGVAPRPFPFTNTFIYLREAKTQDKYTGGSISYEFVKLPFIGEGAPQVIATTTVETKVELAGNYSPVRWARVREESGLFYFSGEGVEPVRLPSPFDSSPGR